MRKLLTREGHATCALENLTRNRSWLLCTLSETVMPNGLMLHAVCWSRGARATQSVNWWMNALCTRCVGARLISRTPAKETNSESSKLSDFRLPCYGSVLNVWLETKHNPMGVWPKIYLDNPKSSRDSTNGSLKDQPNIILTPKLRSDSESELYYSPES